jgi:hypothetical protein
MPIADAFGNFMFGLFFGALVVISLIYDNKKHKRPVFWFFVLAAVYFLRNSIIFYM